jgi:hypothetical protein
MIIFEAKFTGKLVLHVEFENLLVSPKVSSNYASRTALKCVRAHLNFILNAPLLSPPRADLPSREEFYNKRVLCVFLYTSACPRQKDHTKSILLKSKMQLGASLYIVLNVICRIASRRRMVTPFIFFLDSKLLGRHTPEPTLIYLI